MKHPSEMSDEERDTAEEHKHDEDPRSDEKYQRARNALKPRNFNEAVGKATARAKERYRGRRP